MNAPKRPIPKFPVADAETVAENKAERKAVREIRQGLTELIDATEGLMTGLDGAAIASVRTTVKETLRRQRELARTIRSLCKVVAP
jgi:hypothetical protein